VYLESASGGGLRLLTKIESGAGAELDPNWSPDGAMIAYGGESQRENAEIRTIDIRTGRISILPGTQGLWSPRWSPDGRRFAALSYQHLGSS